MGRRWLVVCLPPLLTCGSEDVGPDSVNAKPPNVLIVMIDALRADRLGINGNENGLTPHIDRLAAEGVNFPHAFSHSTWTKPSIATLFTSLYPSQHGLSAVAIPSPEGSESEILADRWTTLAERFAAAGYSTGAVVNQVHIEERFGFAQGFVWFDSYRGRAPLLNRRLIEWLQSLDRERPFFAYLHYLDVHWPYTHRTANSESDRGPTFMTTEPPQSGREEPHKWGETLELPADLAALEARYDHEVAFVDLHLGVLLEELAAMGRYENTVIVVTADHGEGFLEHGELLHGHAPWDELIHVPLVVRLPVELRGPSLAGNHPVGLIDLMPTLLDLAGLAPDPQAQGLNLVPWLRGRALRPRLVFVETESAEAARGAERKVLRFVDGRLEHYDLVADPGEQRPLSSGCGEPCDRLEHRLDDFIEAMAAAQMALDPETTPIDDRGLAEMRSLGYIDGAAWRNR